VTDDKPFENIEFQGENQFQLTDATYSTFTLVNVQMDDAGSYSAYVSNPAGGSTASLGTGKIILSMVIRMNTLM